MKSDNTITGKWRRLAHLAPSVGNLGLNVLLERVLGTTPDHEAHSAAIKDALGKLKGPMMKVAQMLASIPGALPDEYVDTFKELQAKAPPMSPYFAKRMFAAELGDSPESVFKVFEATPMAAASLGQVHQAITQDGAQVACKIQYPDMRATVEDDLAHVRAFLRVLQARGKGLEASLVIEEIKERLYEELDYRLEAKNIETFQQIFERIPQPQITISAPQVHKKYLTPQLLVTDYLEGVPIHELQDVSQDKRNELACALFKAWYFPFYRYGVIHGDPHSGNFTFNPTTKTLNVLDFGCVRVFAPKFVAGVIALYRALQKNSLDACFSAYKQWGFQGLTKDTVAILNKWAVYLYGPLLEDRVRPIADNHSSVEGKKIAAHVFQELRNHGGIVPPQEFVLLDRATVGMGGAFMTLKAELNWHREFEELISGVSEETIAENQKDLGL